MHLGLENKLEVAQPYHATIHIMNNLDIVLAPLTTPNHRFSRLDTAAAFQAATSATSTELGRTLPKLHKTHVFNFLSKAVLNSYD